MKNDLISRKEAFKKIEGYFGDLPIVVHYDMLKIISDLPSTDVPDRKVGEWVIVMDDPRITFDECKCSVCGVVEYFNKGWKKFSYCPNCGARMKGEEDATD